MLQRFKHSVSCGFRDKVFYGALSSVQESLLRDSLVNLEALGLESRQQQLELYCRRDF